jgi:UDP-N-acetylmuramoylalanine--D-glutamate ligase
MLMVKEDELTGKRVLILGLARQGVAMARFAAEVGANVIVSDIRAADELQSNLEALADLSIQTVLGHHPMSLLDGVDLIVVSGGVPLDLPLLVEAERVGLPVTNDSFEFIKRVPCPVVGITGSAGKTTTTALTGAMVKSTGRKTWIGGNIGRPLIPELADMKPDDLVVQELSSFQLELWTLSPTVAAILNITPNHLDRHRNMNAYINAKARILDYQSSEDIAVLSMDDPGAIDLSGRVHGRLRFFSMDTPVEDGAYLEDGVLYIRDGFRKRKICQVSDIPLRGQHNILNVLSAAVLADSVGVPIGAMHEAIVRFKGIPHRLEEVAVINGVHYINDSIATAPERAIAALESFSEPIILLAGGRDKDMVWTRWAEKVLTSTRGIILFGDLAELLESQLSLAGASKIQDGFKVRRVDTLEEAVIASSDIAEPGDVVLLAPGGTSFDSFVDFEARGEAFRKLVFDLAKRPLSNTRFMLN